MTTLDSFIASLMQFRDAHPGSGSLPVAADVTYEYDSSIEHFTAVINDAQPRVDSSAWNGEMVKIGVTQDYLTWADEDDEEIIDDEE